MPKEKCIGKKSLLTMLLMLSSFPAKRYMRNLKKQIEDALSSDEREDFALQMLGTEGDVTCISWVGEGKIKERVRMTKDYALQTSGHGTAVLVELQKVKKVAVDVREYTVTTRGGGFKMQQTATVYPMYFYYQTPVEGEKKKCDKEFTFGQQEYREQVSHYLHERKIGE